MSDDADLERESLIGGEIAEDPYWRKNSLQRFFFEREKAASSLERESTLRVSHV